MILLSGATGFLGSHVLEALLTSNIQDVVITMRNRSSLSKIEHLPRALPHLQFG